MTAGWRVEPLLFSSSPPPGLFSRVPRVWGCSVKGKCMKNLVFAAVGAVVAGVVLAGHGFADTPEDGVTPTSEATAPVEVTESVVPSSEVPVESSVVEVPACAAPVEAPVVSGP